MKKLLTMKVDDKFLQALDAEAKSHNMSRSEFIRECIGEHVPAIKKTTKRWKNKQAENKYFSEYIMRDYQ